MAAVRKLDRKDLTLVYQDEKIHYEQAYSLNHFELLSSMELAEIVAAVLAEILKKTDKLTSTFTSIFYSEYPDRVSITTYLKKLIKEFKCSQECLILSMIYIDRLTKKEPRLVIQTKNVQKLMFTALLLASKYWDDKRQKNEFNAKIGGFSTKEVNTLELEFLKSIEFNLYVNPVLFYRYREHLLSEGRPLLVQTQPVCDSVSV